ncbi:MAG: hypothetical protein EA426_05635 [Spirochaetaceae bacterium]|nr:MAG: hypothetical protein EA426_05635 [Spirochaetaceae bacterium]
MSGSRIGIKLADGSFFAILDRDETDKKKRLVLTTVRDGQTQVHIDLYQGLDSEAAGGEYVGSLVIDGINPATKGEADITLVVGIDADGNLSATATDSSSGERQSLSVGLETLGGGSDFDMPNFEIDDFEAGMDDEMSDVGALQSDDVADDLADPLEDLAELDSELEPESDPIDEDSHVTRSFEIGGPIEPAVPRRAGVFLVVGFVLLALAAVGLLSYLVYRLLQGPDVQPLEAAGLVFAYAEAAIVGITSRL